MDVLTVHILARMGARSETANYADVVLINNAATVGLPKSQELSELRRNSNLVFNNCITSNAIVTTAFIPLLRKSAYPRVIMSSSARGSIRMTANKTVSICVAASVAWLRFS